MPATIIPPVNAIIESTKILHLLFPHVLGRLQDGAPGSASPMPLLIVLYEDELCFITDSSFSCAYTGR